MINKFYPWTIDVDTNAKKSFIRKEIRNRSNGQSTFFRVYYRKTKSLFDMLGVDIMRVKADEKQWDLSADEESEYNGELYRLAVDFLMVGSFIAIPDYQKDLYGDDEMFGKSLPKAIEIVQMEDDNLPTYELDNMNIVFKHPCFHLRSRNFKSGTADMSSVLYLFLRIAEFFVLSRKVLER